MADGPMNAPAISTIVGLCPDCCGSVIAGCGCQRCGWLPGVDRLSPTFNHTRSDGPPAVGETIDVFIDSPSDGRPSVVTAVGETCFLAKVPSVGEMQLPLSACWWRRQCAEVPPLPAGGQIGRAP